MINKWIRKDVTDAVNYTNENINNNLNIEKNENNNNENNNNEYNNNENNINENNN